ncbi:MAG: histidine phosphatase family protein [Propionibacteriaceae bacterium]|jgi:alpha-ribazole phosphatase|nr:histidine phosphatase family protein [Propionibacteriaceae bacterium]
MKVTLIRHGETEWNASHHYQGVTDTPLSDRGKEQAAAITGTLPTPDLLFVSPLGRARSTAAIIYPDVEQIVIDDLHEWNFGVFEGHTRFDLEDDPDYQAWVASKATGRIPGGESLAQMYSRVAPAFRSALAQAADANLVSIVTHGGVIMGILETYATNAPAQPLVENCAPLECTWDGSHLTLHSPFVRQTGYRLPNE